MVTFLELGSNSYYFTLSFVFTLSSISDFNILFKKKIIVKPFKLSAYCCPFLLSVSYCWNDLKLEKIVWLLSCYWLWEQDTIRNRWILNSIGTCQTIWVVEIVIFSLQRICLLGLMLTTSRAPKWNDDLALPDNKTIFMIIAWGYKKLK